VERDSDALVDLGHIMLGGIITESMRYTVALSVCTPPQITLASWDLRLSPSPEIFSLSP